MKTLSVAFQIILGVVLGCVVFAGAGVGVAYYFYTKLAGDPPKPVYQADSQIDNPEKVDSTPVASVPQQATVQIEVPTKSEPQQLTQEEATTQLATLEPGAYKARVTWRDGLILRAMPSTDSERLGGIDFNQEIVILKNSENGKWEKVRVPASGLEGWVKANNTQKIE